MGQSELESRDRKNSLIPESTTWEDSIWWHTIFAVFMCCVIGPALLDKVFGR